MNYARLSRLLVLSLLSAVPAASCSSNHDTADVAASPPGAFQPPGGGKSVDEVTACSTLVKAESEARAALGCPPVTRECPVFIRPAGNAGCFLYDQASLDACTDFFGSFTGCEAFDQRPCLLTVAASCGAGGSDGGGGAAGQGGSVAEAGMAGSAGGAGEIGAGGVSAAGFGG